MNGRIIKKIEAIPSMYNGDSVSAGPLLRIHESVILEMVKHFTFKTEKKKKYTYLVEPTLIMERDERQPEIGGYDPELDEG